jgi:hypothetical protein
LSRRSVSSPSECLNASPVLERDKQGEAPLCAQVKSIIQKTMERVREVGPNKAGTKGSYTVYRIADAG